MKLLFVCLTSVLSFLTMHPLHVSVTEIEMDEKDKRLEIMMRVFVDDVEITMRKKLNQPDLDILHLKNGLTVDQLMREYLAAHFKIQLDGKQQSVKYLGNEIDGDAFIFYNEVSGAKKWKSIRVQNDILMEIHDDQSNLINVTKAGEVKSLRLTGETSTDVLTF